MLTWNYDSVYKVLYFKKNLPCQIQELLFGMFLAVYCLVFNLLSLAVNWPIKINKAELSNSYSTIFKDKDFPLKAHFYVCWVSVRMCI